MTQATSNKTIFERQEEIDYEWKDGDDSLIYDQGYYDAMYRILGIIDSVRNTPNVERVPLQLTMSAVAGTIRELMKEREHGVS